MKNDTNDNNTKTFTQRAKKLATGFVFTTALAGCGGSDQQPKKPSDNQPHAAKLTEERHPARVTVDAKKLSEARQKLEALIDVTQNFLDGKNLETWVSDDDDKNPNPDMHDKRKRSSPVFSDSWYKRDEYFIQFTENGNEYIPHPEKLTWNVITRKELQEMRSLLDRGNDLPLPTLADAISRLKIAKEDTDKCGETTSGFGISPVIYPNWRGIPLRELTPEETAAANAIKMNTKRIYGRFSEVVLKIEALQQSMSDLANSAQAEPPKPGSRAR